jgi:ketosteroid isomerase-like protein
MKMRLVVALVGLAIGFAWPAFDQQKDTPDPQIAKQLDALGKKFDEAFDNNDAAAVAAIFTKDAVLVSPEGPVYGREGIEKLYVNLFQKWHFSNYIAKVDQNSPHIIGTAGNEEWNNGEWSATIQGHNFRPIQIKGYWSAIYALEGGVWKKRMLTVNVTPPPSAPAETSR